MYAFTNIFSRLQRFEKTNEMLSNCNNLSQTRLERATRDFKVHSQHLTQLKRDLDSVFKRIRVLKSKVAGQHPEAFAAVTAAKDDEGREEDDEYDVAIRKQRQQRLLQEKEAGGGAGRISPIPETS